MTPKILVTYNTTSQYKEEELAVTLGTEMIDGRRVGDVFEFEITKHRIQEDLEVDIAAMVASEARKAYSLLKVPCIVEHAGLIFKDYESAGYPGGLTKPMWNTLAERFISETASAGRQAIARAAIAYCDGQRTHTFAGETAGTLAADLRGDRKFYWDTVFIPDEENPDRLTYAELVADGRYGLEHKMKISQSRRALLKFLEYRDSHRPQLWDVRR